MLNLILSVPGAVFVATSAQVVDERGRAVGVFEHLGVLLDVFHAALACNPMV